MTGPDSRAGDDPQPPAYLALLDVLRCPACRSPFLTPDAAAPEELVCSSCRRSYPVRGDVPVLLVDEARLPEGTTVEDRPEDARG